MISLENLRYYCRTCMMRWDSSDNNEDTTKIVLVTQYPEIEHLMYLCLKQGTDGDTEDTLKVHTPNICHSCADKWTNFVEHYQLAIRSDTKLRKMVEGELNEYRVDQMEIGDKFNEVFIETQPLSVSCEIEKYETTSPFYQDTNINATISEQPLTEELNSLLVQLPTHEENETGISNNESPIPLEDQAIIVTESLKNRKLLLKRKTKQRENTTATRKSLKDSNKKLRYHCEPCKKYFYEIQKYEGHVKQVHKGIQKAYQCHTCGKAYNSYKNLGYHIAENHARKSLVIPKCKECNKTFKTSVTLRQHMYHQHSIVKKTINMNNKESSSAAAGQDRTRTICDQCGFMAVHQYSLAQHIKNKHTEAQDMKCEKCPKIFKSQYSLKYHVLSNHMNIKPYQCSECQMTFTRQGLLNVHKRTHINYNERIKCDVEGCDVRFVKHGDKRHHVRLVHLKVKQHICEFCGEAFGALQTLRHHRYIHTGEKPYSCNVCDQGFRQRTAMKTHRKTHFGKEYTAETTIESDNNLVVVNENVDII